ncbi:unnamed protein product [Mytilus edulis]|uniref:Tyr recombinase domain-containing protein n=1 Tax=Mytilus edulis TaxID=6550 RepID=A0A8S3TD98_MYTED|nr:unnamed protein product [Mytilus edulis]
MVFYLEESGGLVGTTRDRSPHRSRAHLTIIFTTPLKKNSKESEELKPRESDEELELRVKLLEEKKQRLKREQLNQRIKELRPEVDGLSKSEEKPKKKSKKSKGEITLTNLRANDKLNKEVNDELKRLGLDFDTKFSGKSDLAETSKEKNVKVKSEKVTNEQELLQQLKKMNLAKGSISKTTQHKKKHLDSKSQKVVQLPESVLRGNSSTESESETSSNSSSEDSSDYELSAKLSSRKKSKKLKSGLKIKSADKVINPQSFPHNFLQYEYVSKDLEFKQLNFKMLVAGELEIINNFCKNKLEKEGRLKLLQKIAYFSSIYNWASVLEFYAAWLRLIELGRKTWSDDSQILENVMLSGQSLPKEVRQANFRSVSKNQNGKEQIWFCVKYQRNKCEHSNSTHTTVIREVSVELKHDLLWWSEFLEIYNGVSLLNLQEWTEPDEYMASDACLVGCGGVSNGQFFHCVFPDFIVQQSLHINALELLSVIVCLKLWGQRGRKICIQCDNMVSVQVINQGKSRSRFLQACLREICFICAIKECELRAIHIDGIENRLPDMLSRWSLSDSYSVQFYEAIEDSVTIGELSLSVDLHMLKTQAQESLKSAHASGTRKNLKIQWKAFFLFCHFYNLKTLPCELNTLCLFAQFLSRSFKSVDSIRNYLNGVKVLHLLFDLPFIHFESFYFRLFMKGLKRCNPHTVRAALPITPSILLKIREELNFDDINSYTYWCIFLFAFYLICRKSNLVGTVDDSSKCLHRENISVFEDYLLVQFRWSKTIQFGERVLEIPIVKNLSSPLCAFSAFKAMCAKFPALASSPAFLVLSGRKTKPVSYNMLQNFLKNIVEKIGLDPTQYSSHSFRRGGATWAFQCGVSSELIQLQGDWKSDAYKLYLRYGLNDKMQVSSKMMCRLKSFYSCRSKYRRACKKAERSYKNKICSEISANVNKDPKTFWNLLQKLSKSCNNEDSVQFAQDEFISYFKKLNKTDESFNPFQEKILKNFETLFDDFQKNNRANDFQEHITTSEIVKAIKSLKNGKSTATDLISNEMLKNGISVKTEEQNGGNKKRT